MSRFMTTVEIAEEIITKSYNYLFMSFLYVKRYRNSSPNIKGADLQLDGAI